MSNPVDNPTAPSSDADRSPTERKDVWNLVLAAIAVMSLIAAVAAVGISASISRNSDGTSASPSAPVGGEVTVEVELGDLYIEPAVIEVPQGAVVTFVVTNVGAMPHDFVLGTGEGTAMLDAGGSETFTTEPIMEGTDAWCTVAGHREAGMEAEIVLTGVDSSTNGHDGHVAAGSGGGSDDDGNAVIDFNAAPDGEWVPFDPVLQPAPGGTHHEIGRAHV